MMSLIRTAKGSASRPPAQRSQPPRRRRARGQAARLALAGRADLAALCRPYPSPRANRATTGFPARNLTEFPRPLSAEQPANLAWFKLGLSGVTLIRQRGHGTVRCPNSCWSTALRRNRDRLKPGLQRAVPTCRRHLDLNHAANLTRTAQPAQTDRVQLPEAGVGPPSLASVHQGPHGYSPWHRSPRLGVVPGSGERLASTAIAFTEMLGSTPLQA